MKARIISEDWQCRWWRVDCLESIWHHNQSHQRWRWKKMHIFLPLLWRIFLYWWKLHSLITMVNREDTLKWEGHLKCSSSFLVLESPGVAELTVFMKEHQIEKSVSYFYHWLVIKEQSIFFSPTSKIGRVHHIKKACSLWAAVAIIIGIHWW